MNAIRATSESLDDQALLSRVARRDRQAFDVLYRRHYRRLLAYVLRRVGRPDLAEEVVNDVLLVVWESAGRFEGRSRVSTWIFGIARRQTLKAIDRRSRRRDDVSTAAVPEEGREDRRSRATELRLSLSKALARLSDDHREVIELTFFHEFSYPEIAEIVDCPVNTVKTRMFHARKNLRRILPELGWRGTS